MPTAYRADLLKGRTALVTGGGTGICRGIALALAEAGADVAITSRKQDHLDPTVEDLKRAVGFPEYYAEEARYRAGG